MCKSNAVNETLMACGLHNVMAPEGVEEIASKRRSSSIKEHSHNVNEQNGARKVPQSIELLYCLWKFNGCTMFNGTIFSIVLKTFLSTVRGITLTNLSLS